MNDRYERSPAPGTWARARRTVARLLEPLDRFLHVEAASGIVLLVTAVAALAWSNSSWGSSYERLWSVPVTLGVGTHALSRSIHFWINDGLMTVFFLVVGMEIRREIHSGELSDRKRATLPLAAALGGMVSPALVYWAVSRGTPVEQGWAVPMATDIAFAVGVLALLGRRVPPPLRVLLLALAIVDDIGAVLVIAVVFSTGVSVVGLLIACGGVGGVIVFQKLGLRRAWFYVLPGTAIWVGLLRAGVHPSMAGVILGLLTPARPWFGEALAPVVRIQSRLHGWVAFGVMPLFALANAGVRAYGVEFGDRSSQLASIGIAAGLFIGKPLGIVLATFVAVRLRWSSLPRGIGWPAILVLGCVGGIGFTMSIFMAELAFGESPTLAAAKLAVLVGSLLSATAGLILGRLSLTSRREQRLARPVESQSIVRRRK